MRFEGWTIESESGGDVRRYATSHVRMNLRRVRLYHVDHTRSYKNSSTLF